jgi:lysophospholipid acyltransferase (LPLAT)-like uncharacterized protein
MIIKIPFFNKKFIIELWEVKAILRLLLRKLAYSFFVQKLITILIYSYLLFVYKTSSKKFIGLEKIYKIIDRKKPIIFAFWHNRLMMMPFFALKVKEQFENHNFMTLASKHGDGKFVGMVMEKFGLVSILGSTKDGRKSSRGIDYSSMRKIINGLKEGCSLGITPDGPRGPNQKINGELLNIARITESYIVAISYSSSNFKIIKKSWDKFKIPLPFAKLCFVVDEIYFEVEKDSSSEKENLALQKNAITERLNFAQKKCDKFLKKDYDNLN